MSHPLQGVRVVEVAAWTFVPAAGAMLADLGADVIKVEPPNGDPQRGLMNMLNREEAATNPFIEIPNRGKRSVTIDLTNDRGREVLLTLIKTADVFLTSYLPALRTRMGINPEDLHAVNPRLIYVRGHGWGAKGDMANTGGYDMAAAWAAGGFAYKLTEPDADSPPMQPAAFYDLHGSSTIAGAVGTALFARERSGEGSVVDVSLLGTALWTMAPDIVGAQAMGGMPKTERRTATNPISNFYRTADNRWLALVCLQADRFWPELMTLVDRADLVSDPRFADASTRFANRVECIETLDAIFAAKTLREWEDILVKFSGVWSPVRNFEEMYDFPQVDANGMLPEVTRHDGGTYRTPGPAAQFDGEAAVPQGPAPEVGQHTEEVLLSAGLDWDAISAYREQGALG